MRGSKLLLVIAGGLLATPGGSGTALAQTSAVHVRGAPWASQRLIDSLEASFSDSSPDLQLDWRSAGPRSAFIGLFDGSADIGISARSANPKERELARRLGVDLREFVIALDSIAVIVHPSNPVASLSLDQLRTLYSGKIVRWMGFGGGDDAVRLLAPAHDSGVSAALTQLLFQEEGAIAAGVEIIEPGERLVSVVASDVRAVPLVWDGASGQAVLPGGPAVLDASYPLVYGVRAYTRGDPTMESHRVLSFLMWREGRHQLEQSGFVPLYGFGAVKRDTGSDAPPVPPGVTRIGFGFRGARLDNRARDQLVALSALAGDGEQQIWIVGHEEPEEGSPTRDLALERAQSVARFLEAQGLPATRMTMESAGLDAPIEPNDTLDGRRANRRVDVWVLTNP